MNIPEELLPVIEWWEKDGKKTLVVVAIAGAAALAWWGWNARAARMRDNAANALLGYSDVETLQDAVNQYGGEAAGPMLKLRLAAAYFARQEEGDVQNALDIYESVAGSVPEGFEDVPVLGRAECLEALERYADAQKAYADYVESAATNSIMLLTARLGVERCRAQTGSRDEAAAALEDMKKDFKSDEAALDRIDAALDAVKRWTKREEPAFAPLAAAPAAAAAPETAEAAPEAAPADATKITLPGITPAAPAAAPAASEAPEAQPAPAPQPAQ